MLISKESSQDELKVVTKTFAEKALNVKFSGVKRNNKDEITAIKINAKATNGKASASYASDNDEGINPIQISFDNENNNISIGSSQGRHMSELHFSDGENHENMKHHMKSDGKKMIFISKDGDNEGDEEDEDINIWIDEKGDTTKIIKKKIMVKMNEGEDHEDIHEIIIEEDGNGKKIKKEIIKIKGSKGDGKESKKEKIIVISDSENENPLIILNGKEISKKEMEELDPDSIKMIDVLKGDKATEKHGDKGKDGVIIITTKK